MRERLRLSCRVSFFRFCLAVGGALFLCFQSVEAQGRRFGLWVEAEGDNQPFSTKAGFEEYLRYIETYPFTDVYCQVYRGGRSWYPSMFADDTPYRAARGQGFDPLGETIRSAKQRGQKVHAWVNVLRVFQNPNAPLLKIVGAERAVQYDNFGTSVLEYTPEGAPPGSGRGFTLGTHGIWIDPGDPAVRRYIIESIKDVVLHYPDLDGVHLDMVRFPTAIRTDYKKKLDVRPEYGFSDNSIRRFFVTAGREAPAVIDQKLRRQLTQTQAWSAWRRAQVTLLVFEIREMLNQIAPGMALSAAVFADQDRARNGAFQDWPTWMQYELLDTVVPMNYTKRFDLYTRLSKEASNVALRPRLLMGVGAWLLKSNPSDMIRQSEIAMQTGSGGVVLFSYSNLYSNSGRRAVAQLSSALFPPTNHVLKNDAR